MRLGFLRRKNTDLPLFNNRRNGNRSPSPHRKTITRKHIYVGLFVFALLLLLFHSASSPTKKRQAKNRYDKYFNAREDLFNNRLFFIKSVASVCTNLDKNSTFWEQSAARYAPLGMEENAAGNTNHKYYFAVILKDSANHLPTIVDNLLRIVYHIGEQNVFVSMYQGGSQDEGHTTAMIETFTTTMDAIGLEYRIQKEVEGTDPRNMVLAPLKELYRTEGRVFNTVVMMRDDLFCAEEFLELLFHSRGQNTSITCSTDVRSRDNVFSIYPGHDVDGRLFQSGRISSYFQHELSASRFRNNYPVRVQTCSSSITAFDPTPFYPPYDFSFSNPNLSQQEGSSWVRDCGFTPELDMALRYAASGFNRELIVPRTQTASNLLDFFKIHRNQAELAEREQLHRQLGVWVEEETGGKENPFAKDYSIHENEIVFLNDADVADQFECRRANGVEWVKLSSRQNYEDRLVIHRGLPSLDAAGTDNNTD